MLVAPAMNNDMYVNAATRANIETLRERGVTVLEPGTGELASKGEYGIGRLPEPADLLAETERLVAGEDAAFAPRSLDGLKILITAGGTREPIDDVRFVGNRSSGKMGFALADEAAARGAEVTVRRRQRRAGPQSCGRTTSTSRPPPSWKRPSASTSPATDALVMAAAVADFRPVDPAEGKIKKAGRDAHDDRADGHQRHPRRRSPATGATSQVIVGFAAESGPDLLAEAKRKLEHKGLDLIVANDISDPSIGFESGENEVTLIGADLTPERPPRGSKRAVAAAILDRVAALAADREAATERRGRPA